MEQQPNFEEQKEQKPQEEKDNWQKPLGIFLMILGSLGIILAFFAAFATIMFSSDPRANFIFLVSFLFFSLIPIMMLIVGVKFIKGLKNQKIKKAMLIIVLIVLISGPVILLVRNSLNPNYWKIAGEAIKNKNENLCEKIPHDNYNHSYCYREIAIAKNDLQLCEKAAEHRDYCYEQIAGERGDADLCDKVSDKSNCYSHVAIEKNDPDLCERSEGENKDNCYSRLAELREDGSLCEKVSLEVDNCYFRTARAKNDSTLCGKISSENMRKNCYDGLNTY